MKGPILVNEESMSDTQLPGSQRIFTLDLRAELSENSKTASRMTFRAAKPYEIIVFQWYIRSIWGFWSVFQNLDYTKPFVYKHTNVNVMIQKYRDEFCLLVQRKWHTQFL